MKQTNKTYKELNKRISEISRIEDLGIERYYKKDLTKLILGSALAGLGVITLPFPTGSIVMISTGISLIISSGVDLYGYKNKIINKIKFKLWRIGL